jgi:hypothetical protein
MDRGIDRGRSRSPEDRHSERHYERSHPSRYEENRDEVREPTEIERTDKTPTKPRGRPDGFDREWSTPGPREKDVSNNGAGRKNTEKELRTELSMLQQRLRHIEEMGPGHTSKGTPERTTQPQPTDQHITQPEELKRRIIQIERKAESHEHAKTGQLPDGLTKTSQHGGTTISVEANGYYREKPGDTRTDWRVTELSKMERQHGNWLDKIISMIGLM